MADHKGLPVLAFPSQETWEGWLAEHGATSRGIWLKLAKKTSGVASVGKAEAIEAAIAFGWIDGQLDRFDDQFWLVRFTPRGPRSKWSKTNVETASKLIESDPKLKTDVALKLAIILTGEDDVCGVAVQYQNAVENTTCQADRDDFAIQARDFQIQCKAQSPGETVQSSRVLPMSTISADSSTSNADSTAEPVDSPDEDLNSTIPLQ